MTETLQHKIEEIYYWSDDDGETGFGIQIKDKIDKAIQELREQINQQYKLLDKFTNEYSNGVQDALDGVLTLIGEKK